jgi:membrane-bound metal-dependent hydrolase YbcI (DUF457 family)
MTPWGHAAVGLGLAGAAAAWGWRARLPGLLLGSVLPDIDFVLLVPLLGRQRGHRTITHAPVFQLWLAWRLRRMGFWSLLVGQLAHSVADSLGPGNPAGVAWLWPLVWRRVAPGWRHQET